MVARPAFRAIICAAWAWGAALAHPEKLICKDPRFVEGGMMMHNYVVSNQYTDGLLFAASADSYRAGDEVTLTVEANGSRYVSASAPKGVFLAIQSRSACTLVGDHGKFVDMSSDLNATTGCDSGVFSRTAGGAFAGRSSATWRAGSGTTGSVTFTLLWSNGPGASDPLSVAGKVRVPDTYLFMKTLTLTGPEGPCPPPSPPVPPAPPAPQPSKDRCVWSGGRCPLEGAGAPVFVQVLDAEDGEVIFPSGKCLRCRADYRGVCRSAKVTCPASPGQPLEEHIWASSAACEGRPTRIAYLPPDLAYCPGPDEYSVASLDLERFVPKLLRDHGHHVKDEAMARAAVAEYRKMLLLIQRFPERPVVPSKLVDLVWHEHILDTMQYKRDCLRMFGRYVHHNPSFGDDEERAELSEKQTDMFDLYREAFQAEPPMSVWPTAATTQRLGAGGPLPDCCSAKCVKPSCHDCVGCNSVNCGYLGSPAEASTAARRLASPEALGGYIPALNPLTEPPPAPEYLCSLEWNGPRGNPYAMSLDWTIVGDRVYFRQALYGLSAWYSLGFSGRERHDMGFGDFMLSMFSKNYSGVKDLYKYDAGNGYPCFDVLHECSADNQTQGTKDVENDSIRRENGMTESTWSRKLRPADVKDWPIERGNTTVLLAHGTEDYFTYHAHHRATCQVDFFDGFVHCGATSVKTAPNLRPTNLV